MKEGDLVAGRYRLLRSIGAGAMGTVWAARHELLGREVAIKVAAVTDRGGGRASAEARDLFLREVRIVGKLRHANVVDIDDAGDAGDDQLYLAMELLAGESLAQRIARGPFPPAEALAVAAEVCRGLGAVHAAGVVHRDVKPENVFLSAGPSGGVVPKLLDFGISSARGVATIHPSKQFGTPAYMSPEQALGERGVDPRADLWALGVVLYEMLTARLPFEAPTYPALLPLIVEAPYRPLPPSIPAEVRTVVAGCLAKDRGDRYPTADALIEAIDRARAALPTAEPASTRSGFFVETGRIVPASAPASSAAYGARTARFGLAIAILALPVAVGIAALARGLRAPSPTPALARPPGDAPAPPPPSPAVEPASCHAAHAAAAVPAPPPEAPAASASVPVTSAKAGRRPAPLLPAPRPKLTSVNNAGL